MPRSSCSCACSPGRAARDPRRARGAGDGHRRGAAARDRALPRARRALRRDGRRGRPVPAGPRSRARAAHRRPRRSCPRARASRRSTQGAGAAEDDPLGWAFGELGIADRAQAPREPLHRRSRRRDPRRHRPRFELVALRRAAGGERADVRSAARRARGRADPGRHHARRARARAVRAPPARRGRPDRAVPRQRLRRVPDRPRDQGGSRRRRARSLGGGYVNTELRELSDPRVFDYVDFVTLDDGEAPLLALLDHLRDPGKPLLPHLRARGRARRLVSDDSLHDVPLARRPARRPTRACRSIATCRCSRCSTRCTGCGPTAAGTS